MAAIPKSVQESVDSTKVEYRQLGKSGLRVSVPILGAMSFGNEQWQPWVIGEDKALPTLKAAYDLGLNTWDTANVYSNGESEEIIGKALKKYNIPRDKVVIMTKCCAAVGESPEIRSTSITALLPKSKDYINHYGLSRQAILTAVEASLRRLNTPYIDLYQIHRFDPSTPIEETMSTLHSLILSGKVRYIGASSMWAHQFAMMQHCAEKNGWTKFVSMQNHYSLLYREEEREMNKYCDLTGVGLIPWSPLARGFLARPLESKEKLVTTKRSESMYGNGNGNTAVTNSIRYPPAITSADEQIINRVEKLATEKDWPMSQVAMAWIGKRVTSPIIGFSSVGRLEEAVGARGKVLSREEERGLEECYVDRGVSGHV
ncbi:hypothetical protein JMJ35_008229 [Cladonia borealis]|uniref:NADP-dependent oxidoreductase domain-containing protein n=1 Tax=Cladonia borealis TaxID=184061 RepID=A0AA39V7A8_9LECA|nr:hypothetical protein JMJ35_008229 [Cladonia borealis]